MSDYLKPSQSADLESLSTEDLMRLSLAVDLNARSNKAIIVKAVTNFESLNYSERVGLVGMIGLVRSTEEAILAITS